MKKYCIIILLVVGTILAAVGFILQFSIKRPDNSFKKYYDKMQISEKGINGYIVNVRINGTYMNRTLTQHISIMNYMNRSFKIVETSNADEVYNEEGMIIQDALYYIDGVYYRINESNEYYVVNEQSVYNNTNQFIIPIKEVDLIKEEFEDIIATTSYNTYTFIAQKETVKELIDSIGLSIEISEDTHGSLWVRPDGYIYKVEYHFTDTLYLSASFTAVGNIPPIKVNK